MKRPYAAFGDFYRQARRERKMTQPEVAQQAGITGEFYGRVERGLIPCSLTTLATLREVLGVDANTQLEALRQKAKPMQQASRQIVEPLYDVTVERYMRFGREVMLARVKKNLTQTAVAGAVGRTLNYYARIERGRQLPSLLLFARMHNGLGFDANRVLEAMGEEPEERAYGPHSRLGVYLAHARDQCEQTIASAAKAVGCSAEAYERIELGERLPTLAELVRMHRVVRFNANIVLRRIDLELLDQDGA